MQKTLAAQTRKSFFVNCVIEKNPINRNRMSKRVILAVINDFWLNNTFKVCPTKEKKFTTSSFHMSGSWDFGEQVATSDQF
jgi:hypothetical protein